jgi:nucleoside-diphosphate-sugar epimerase
MENVRSEALEGCEALIHLAAHSANVPYDTLENCLVENVIKPLALFRAAILAGVRRFIVAGTCFEYGREGERHEFIAATAGLFPTQSYPASKAAASVVLHALACEASLELLILRIFQVYGEGEAYGRFWPSLRQAALSGEDFEMTEGSQVRDFVPVQRVAAAFVEALARQDLEPGRPKIENLGSGQPMSLAEFAEREWQRFGATGKLIRGAKPMRVGEIMRYAPRMPERK